LSIDIRSERPGDEPTIDAVNSLAFGSTCEPNLVRLLRAYYPCYDRRYSFTAWDGDEMVGHALFAPGSIRLMGATLPALMVGPVAVIPSRQRSGIGGMLMEHGHAQGRREGFDLAVLYGHPTYYPRFGYKACLGAGKVTIDVEKLPSPAQTLRPWPVRPADIPWLCGCFAQEWADVDFAWLRGTGLGEWDIPGIDAAVWPTDEGRPAAYVAKGIPGQMVIGDDAILVRDALGTIRPESLAQHPSGWLARNVLDAVWGTAEATAFDAAMACELQDGVPGPCLEALAAGQRLPGQCPWPLAIKPLS